MKYCRSDAENQMAVLIKLDQLIRYLKLDIISYPDNLRHIYFDLLPFDTETVNCNFQIFQVDNVM